MPPSPPASPVAPAPSSEPVDWQTDAPFSPRYGDRYHSSSGARAQAGHVFLAGCRLPECWQQDEHWVILETGFGLGLNFLSTWACWLASPRRPARLRFVSVEAHPVSAADIRRAAALDPVLRPLGERLADAWPLQAADAAGPVQAPLSPSGLSASTDMLLPPHAFDPPSAISADTPRMPDAPDGIAGSATPTGCPAIRRSFSQPEGCIELRVLIGDAHPCLEQWRLQHGPLGAHSVFLDGFNPRHNPAIWSSATLQAVAAHCRPGAGIATWCVARSVRDSLAAAGFVVHKRPGLPPKRDCLAGHWPTNHQQAD